MDDPDALSAYLDDELDPLARAGIEEELSASPEYRSQLERLSAARSAVASAALWPEASEVAALDSAVAAALDAHVATSRSTSQSKDAPASLDRKQVRHTSPRKQGRPAWPYFAAAAGIAVVLSIGLVLLAQTLGGRVTSSDTALAPATAPSRPAPADLATPQGEADATTSNGSAESGSGAAEAPAPQAPRYVAPIAEEGPLLVLSELDITDTAGLGMLLASAPAAPSDRQAAIATLEALASGTGLDDLAPCLDALGPSRSPSRVDSGTFGGTPAWFVTSGALGGAATSVTAFDRASCEVLGSYGR